MSKIWRSWDNWWRSRESVPSEPRWMPRCEICGAIGSDPYKIHDVVWGPPLMRQPKDSSLPGIPNPGIRIHRLCQYCKPKFEAAFTD
jgi:hypothetical protein